MALLVHPALVLSQVLGPDFICCSELISCTAVWHAGEWGAVQSCRTHTFHITRRLYAGSLLLYGVVVFN